MENRLKKLMNHVQEHKSKYITACIALVAIVILIILGQTLGKKAEYTITFNTNGGSHIDSIVVKENDTIPKPEDPTKEGYAFAGWYYKDELYDFDTPVTSNMELEARWEGTGKVSGISLNQTNLELYVGETYTLVATITPENAKDKSLTWKSSSPEIVSIDSNGNIKALKAGKATITVTTKDGGFTAKATITVKEKIEEIPVTGVSLNKTSLTLTEGDSYRLVATVKPSNATNKNVTWKSSNPKVATVDSNGKVKALKVGTTTITVATKDGGYTAKVTITVKAKQVIKVTGVSLNKTSLTLTEGDNYKLVATVNPSNATNKNVTWKSSNPEVATVDSNGNIKALKPGTTTITVTTKDGEYSATCQITVEAKPDTYSVVFTPIVQEGTNAVFQYSVAITKNSSAYNGFSFVIYNNTKIANGHHLELNKYNKNVTSATIRLTDGRDVTANVIYK